MNVVEAPGASAGTVNGTVVASGSVMTSCPDCVAIVPTFWIVNVVVTASPGKAEVARALAEIERTGRRSVVSDCAEIAPYAFAFASVHVTDPVNVSFLLSKDATRARYCASVSPAAFGAIAGTV